MSRALEPSPEAFARLVDATMERLVAHLDSLATLPAAQTTGGAELAAQVAAPELPEAGQPFEELLDVVFDQVLRVTFNTAGPGYLAYIPGGGLLISAVAELITNTINRFPGVWVAAPGLVQIEVDAVRWLAQIIGYPVGAGGFLTTGGSLANFGAVFTARRERLGDDLSRGVLYASDQAHHSVLKAALLAGLPASRVRAIATDERFVMRMDALRDAVAADRDAGLAPFLVVGSAGTTNTGAVDPLPELATFCERERLWLHIDAAYGGFFALTERGREALAGLERADSVTLDPHKSLFLPYGTGCLLARDRETLRRAHAVDAEYMPPMQSHPDHVDFCAISPELSRECRGLRVWLPMKLYGAGAFRTYLDEKLDLIATVAEALRQLDDVEIVAAPQLTVLAFRLRPRSDDGGAEDARNHRLLDRINARQRVYLTGTRLHERFVIRVCILHLRTHADRVAMALDDIRAAIAEVTTGQGATS